MRCESVDHEREHGLVLPVHDFVQECLSTEIMTRLTLLLEQTALYDRLGRNTGMIETRNEQGRLSQHAIPGQGTVGGDMRREDRTDQRINPSWMATVRA